MDTIPGNDPMEKHAPLAGLDPAQLLKQGAAADTFADTAPASFNPPPIEELAKIFPQFEILELIGKGGMGAVYKVRQKDLDRIVALKILPPSIGQSPEFSERFTREARALAKLNHPGIVTLHEFGQQDGLYFILMEFVDGVNLAQLMKTGRISPREALAIVPQICDALQYAHDQGIVHRDIKPENILLDRSGRVKVADFGIAKVVAAVCDRRTDEDESQRRSQTDATLAGKIIGTPAYMAPEQIDHPSEVDHRADIYALGVVFYQMLTGELPGKDLQAPSRKVSIDVRLDEIVLKALEKAPELRYQTAGILKTRVETIVSEMGSAAIPVASFRVESSATDERASGGAPDAARGTRAIPSMRFCRTAIVGACWAPLILFAYIMWFSVSVSVPLSPGEEPPGPSWWQYLMIFTLLPLGITSPFGTTILGWVSVSRIRRSAGKLHGMWLAVLDGLLFPLLVLTGLIGWFWHWVFYDLVRTVIIAGQPELSTLERLIVNNTTPFTVLATLMSSLAAGLIIIRLVWRAVNTSSSSASKQPPPGMSSIGRVIAIGCGLLLLVGLVLLMIPVVFFWLREPRLVVRDETDAQPVPLRSVKNSQSPSEKKLAEYDWKNLAAEGRTGYGVTQTLDGRTVLKIENLKDEPLLARLLTIEKPPISATNYAVSGEVRYENVQGKGYMEMWSDFQEGRFFSRTLGDPGSGPLSQLAGTSDWREFTLPFDRTGTTNVPTRIEANLFLPGRGVVFVGPLSLMEVSSVEATGKSGRSAVAIAAKEWLSVIDAGDYAQSWEDAAESFHRAVTKEQWVEKSEQVRKPLGEVISRKLAESRQMTTFPGLPQGAYFETQFETSFAGLKQAKETLTFSQEKSGQWRVIGYLIKPVFEGKAEAVGPPEQAVIDSAEAWLKGIDAGNYAQSWKGAAVLFKAAITEAGWSDALVKVRKPLGDLSSRKLLSAKGTKSLPGFLDGKYLVIQFDTTFAAKAEAVETVTFMLEKDGSWKPSGYFIR